MPNRQNTIATFRTECFNDIPRAKDMLAYLDAKIVNEKELSDINMPDYKMGQFTIELPKPYTTETFAEKLISLSITDERFVDLHRCGQTLNEGLEPSF